MPASGTDGSGIQGFVDALISGTTDDVLGIAYPAGTDEPNFDDLTFITPNGPFVANVIVVMNYPDGSTETVARLEGSYLYELTEDVFKFIEMEDVPTCPTL